jgi:hypothetical protein
MEADVGLRKSARYRLRREAEATHERLFEQQRLLRRRPKQNAAKIKQLQVEIEKTLALLEKHWLGIFPQWKW